MLGRMERGHRGAAARPRADAPGAGGSGGIAVWGIGGFVAVAAFWILAGVLSLTDSPARELAPPRDALKTEPPGCTALMLDRQLGSTTAQPCRHAAPLREVLASSQADLARP
ncbi:MAG: hypothetical protein AB7O44_28680 [Hyphomicrobiaceae bacterium]